MIVTIMNTEDDDTDNDDNDYSDDNDDDYDKDEWRRWWLLQWWKTTMTINLNEKNLSLKFIPLIFFQCFYLFVRWLNCDIFYGDV